MRVRVYKNLHTGTLSMQTYIKGKGWRVHSHPHSVVLGDAKFLVYEAGRQRVLREQRKNVHAYVEGVLLYGVHSPHGKSNIQGLKRALYNPYKQATWTDVDGNEITSCTVATVSVHDGVHFTHHTTSIPHKEKYAS